VTFRLPVRIMDAADRDTPSAEANSETVIDSAICLNVRDIVKPRGSLLVNASNMRQATTRVKPRRGRLHVVTHPAVINWTACPTEPT